MARLARSTVAGYPHQVTQRGNYGQRVFEEDEDFRRYLALSSEYVARYSIDVWAYCLMPNHIHFICVPRIEGALARGLNTLHMRYAQYFHAKKGVTGHLWKGRFLSCMLDNQSLFEEARYIENNPVRSGLVSRAEEYRWSSARHHILGMDDPLIRKDSFLKNEVADWPSYLAGDGNEPVLSHTWHCLKTGRPAGNADWVHQLEVIVGRRLEALPRGRPRKSRIYQEPRGAE